MPPPVIGPRPPVARRTDTPEERAPSLTDAIQDAGRGWLSRQTGVTGYRPQKDSVKDLAGAAVGVAGLKGFRYAVEAYSERVDDTLTRGSRLDDMKMLSLVDQGYASVVSLCLEDDGDVANAAAAKIKSFRVPILDNWHPTTEQVKSFLDFVTKPENQPAYVHCEAGIGRTGLMVACYRMAVSGFTVEQALAEAKEHGLSLEGQIRFIKQFAEDLSAGRIEGYPRRKE